MRPAPGDRGAWSHGPIARVHPRPVDADDPTNHGVAHPSRPVRPPLPPLPRSAVHLAAEPRPTPPNAPRPTTAAALVPQPGLARQAAAPGLGRPVLQQPSGPRSGYQQPAVPRPALPPARNGFGLPSLRRNVCPHFYMTGSRGAIPIQAPHLLKGLLRQPANVSRCQLRGGVHLDEGYVNDVCLTPRFNQCVFYEDELTRE